MDDGVLPSLARADEFDLMASFSKPGDRQRRDDERNLFLDLLLAARDRLLIAYTGRSIRDNAALPPAALVDELLDHLATVSAGQDAGPDEVEAARGAFIVNHPLQPFSADYFAARSDQAASALFTYDPDRAELAELLALQHVEARVPFFSQPLPASTAPLVAFDHFQRFWRHPARALLRDRLGIVLADAQAELLDSEPFELDYAGSDALAARLMPMLLDAQERTHTLERARRVAVASPELPGGATGAVWRERELNALRLLADRVQSEIAGGVERLPFALTIDSRWPDTADVPLFGPHERALREAAEATPLELHGSLNLLTENGQVIFRYARPGARDYLAAWLAHLVYCAAQPAGPRRTVWHGNGETFEFAPVDAPLDRLAPLAALYRAGQMLPLRFFPRSAWKKLTESESAAQGAWINDRTGGESDDPAWRIALRGTPLTLDEPFGTLASLVFEPLVTHLRSAS
jgi:exodeoxyribonuclease V gamma subunit